MSQLGERININRNLQLSNSQQSPNKKYQYYTNSISKSAISASTIDNHRNSIQQRIANLQAKISQKYNKFGESRKDKFMGEQKKDRFMGEQRKDRQEGEYKINRGLTEQRKDRGSLSQNYVPIKSSTNKNDQTSLKNTINYPLSSQVIQKRNIPSNQKLSRQSIQNESLKSYQKLSVQSNQKFSREQRQNVSRPLSSTVSKSVNNPLPVYTPLSNQRNSINYKSQLQNQSPNHNRYSKYNYLTINNNDIEDKLKQSKQLNKYTNNDKILQTKPTDRNQLFDHAKQTLNTDRIKDITYYKTLNFNKITTTKLQPQNYSQKYSNHYQTNNLQQYQQTINNKHQHKYDTISQNYLENKTNFNTQKPLNRIKNQTHSLPKYTQPLTSYPQKIPNIQQQFTNLNRTISSLRKQPKVYDNFMAKQNIPQYPTQITPSNIKINQTQIKQNAELYQMMKTILLGQERLQKQLQIIKNKQISTLKNNQIQPKQSITQQQNLYQNDSNKFALRQKKYTNPKITQSSFHKPNINSLATSPLKNNNQKSSKSPLQHKNINDKEISKSQQGSVIKQRRCNSAAQSKKKTGKITKNNKQQQFMQLYKQAQKQKHLNPLNSRISISQQAISSVWDRIKSVIQRSSLEDIESSKVYHENNRYINDHLVNSIELQRRLKNDLVKKVYDMCENKCLFK